MNDMSMEDYVKDAKNKITKLKAAGEVITDKYAAAQVLRGVPDTYKFYKVTWDNKKEVEKTLEALWRGLLRADEREQEIGSGTAFSAKGGKKKQQSKVTTKNNLPKSNIPKKTKKECYFCGKPGHFKSDCYHFKKEQKEKKNTKNEQLLLYVKHKLMSVKCQVGLRTVALVFIWPTIETCFANLMRIEAVNLSG